MKRRKRGKAPANRLIMENPVTKRTDGIERSRNIFSLSLRLGKIWESPTQGFPKDFFIFGIEKGYPETHRQLTVDFIRSHTLTPGCYMVVCGGDILIQ